MYVSRKYLLRIIIISTLRNIATLRQFSRNRTNISLSIPAKARTNLHCTSFDTRLSSPFICPASGSLVDRVGIKGIKGRGKFFAWKNFWRNGKRRGTKKISASIPFLMAQIRHKGRQNKSKRNGWNWRNRRPVPFILGEGYTPLACSLETFFRARWLLCVGSVPIAQTLQRVDFVRPGANNYEISNEPPYFLFSPFRL